MHEIIYKIRGRILSKEVSRTTDKSRNENIIAKRRGAWISIHSSFYLLLKIEVGKFPTAYHGQHKGKQKISTLTMEAFWTTDYICGTSFLGWHVLKIILLYLKHHFSLFILKMEHIHDRVNLNFSQLK